MREPFWWVMFPGDFAARCKANGNRMELESKHGGKIRFGGGLFVHTFNRLLPPEEFFATHLSTSRKSTASGPPTVRSSASPTPTCSGS